LLFGVIVLALVIAGIVYARDIFAEPLHRVLVFLFNPDMARGVFWGSLIVTFVASVMGKDQQQRLDQGKFGLAAGTSLGGISGLIEKEPALLVVGFVGSAVGGLLGWLFYLVLASLLVRFPKCESLVTFQTGGLESLQKQLDLKSKENLRIGFNLWTDRFSLMMADARRTLLCRPPASDVKWEDQAVALIHSWLTTAVDTLALVFGTLADKPQYQSRVTIIVYKISGTGGETRATGKHWISYAGGNLKPHDKNQSFDEKSVGYKVLVQQLGSPYFTTKEIAQKEGQARTNDVSYRPFITFRLNDSAILAVDWPEELKEEDGYVKAAESLFNSDVMLAITDLLSRWPNPLADSAGLGLQQASDSPVETKKASASASANAHIEQEPSAPLGSSRPTETGGENAQLKIPTPPTTAAVQPDQSDVPPVS
jgi:hypothetical protein